MRLWLTSTSTFCHVVSIKNTFDSGRLVTNSLWSQLGDYFELIGTGRIRDDDDKMCMCMCMCGVLFSFLASFKVGN